MTQFKKKRLKVPSEDQCQRCRNHWRKCTCEESLRPGRYDHQDDKYEEDEERADDFRRDYLGDGEEKTTAYWHGWNTVRKYGTRKLITWCPYQGAARKEFFRGVSDARQSLS
jgi:hypothetical protein